MASLSACLGRAGGFFCFAMSSISARFLASRAFNVSPTILVSRIADGACNLAMNLAIR